MKYDDSTWHSDGDFPDDLPPEAGGTHIGMFMAWALMQNLGSAEAANYRGDVMAQRDTPGALLMQHCDGKIINDDLNDRGNSFASYYYEKHYYADLEAIIGREVATLYHMPDSWETFRKIEPGLTQRLAEFTAAR